ncbi:MAG: VCBS repeat-containing protein [Planctomycetes bacterium]|nr:VCBS repeat-containing protein [Planctomycetota bacterium]
MNNRKRQKMISFLTTNKTRRLFLLVCLSLTLFVWCRSAQARIQWQRKTLPGPNSGSQQTACIIADLDKDGIDDFIVTERTKTPSVVWYKYNGKSWDMKIIDNTQLKPEAGGDVCDIDRDGDLDVIFGQDASGNKIWWWENPYPVYSRPWKRYTIKNANGNKHHDQTVGDFDGDGKLEFISWHQRAKKLLLYEIPSNPKQTGPWSSTTIYSWNSGREREGFPSIPMDIDLDGKVDIVGGGRWFKHQRGTRFQENVIDADMAFTQCAVGQLVKGGRPEVVFSPGDMNGDARWYQWNGQAWIAQTLRYIIHGHTCEIRDIDNDGNQDIFIGEMGKPGAGDNAKTYIWYGNGKGGFTETVASHGQGIHEGKLADLDGDGDLDILMKPYNHNSPRVDVLLNKGVKKVFLNKWKRHFIDALPQRAMFILSADIDSDGHKDLVAGGWWWKNPGKLSGKWKQKTIGEPLRNMAVVYDFDGDGDPDILGTEGVGAAKNTTFVWAQNNGKGQFSVLKNINYRGGGDFLQGCTVGRLDSGLQVALSWHRDGGGIHVLNVPSDPAKTKWTSTLLSTTVSSPPQGEDLDYGDIDRDGDLDLLLGDVWLRNDGGKWTTFRLGRITEGESDRVDLADVNGDGRLDAVISLENGTDVWWFEAPDNAADTWKRHKIGVIAGQGFSMDTVDFDGDGDPDVVIGEHRGKQENRVVLFENVRAGNRWKQHVIDKDSKSNIDHHDGTQAVDLDGDGDLDIISIGWYNPKVWVFENL